MAASERKQFVVSALTSTTGVTLIPKVGELVDQVLSPASIEITYSVRPAFWVDDQVYEIQIERK
jgi:hypothetical protein